MPSKYTIREFDIGSYYHIYNRGVDKMNIFRDERDYKVFLYYIKVFLSPADSLDTTEPFYEYRRKNFYGHALLHCYCLMPNHFHLFMSGLGETGISNFMQALSNAYTRYFNKRYKRVGPLFQGKFKAARVQSDSYYLHLSRYIHLNPSGIGHEPAKYPYSSLPYYLDDSLEQPIWLSVQEVRDAIGTAKQYLDFVMDYKPESVEQIRSITIDADE